MKTNIRWIALSLPLLSFACGDDAPSDPDIVEDASVPDAQDDVDSAVPVTDNCSGVHARDAFPTFDVEMAPADLTALNAEFDTAIMAPTPPAAFSSYPATFKHDGQSVASAEIRLSGPVLHWCYDPAANGMQGPKQCKRQFVISFEKVDDPQRFQGLRELLLVAPSFDRSFLNQRLALWYMRSQGLPAPCANNARLSINGEYAGLYTNIEQVDESFIARNFPGKIGDVFANGFDPTTTHAPNWDRLQSFQRTCCDTRYAGDPTCTGSATPLVCGIEQLDLLMDLDHAIKEWAAEAMLPHGDGFWGVSASHYLYDHPDRGYLYIPAGLGASLSHMPANIDPLQWSAPWTVGQPLKYLRVLADAARRSQYVQALEAAHAAFDVAGMRALVSQWSTQIAEAAAQDTAKQFTTMDHGAAVSQLRTFIESRSVFVASWLTCAKGSGPDGDLDGHPWCRDCDDTKNTVHPGATEVAGNGIDDDCNGRRDETGPLF